MFCTKCGAQLSDSAQFCTNCGQQLSRSADTASLQRRDPIMMIVFTIITFGIYGIYWYVVTKLEINASGAQIPTAWLIIVPIVNIWWMWKFCEGVELVTSSRMNGAVAFLLLFFLGIIGGAVIQDSLNKVASS